MVDFSESNLVQLLPKTNQKSPNIFINFKKCQKFHTITVPQNGQNKKKIAKARHHIFLKGYNLGHLKMVKWKCFIHIQRNKFAKPPFLEIFWLKIGWKENFIMQMAYCDENLFNIFFYQNASRKGGFVNLFLWILGYERFSFHHFWIP